MGYRDSEEREVCGTCRWNRYDRESKDFYCGNKDGDNHGASTAYDDSCRDWEEKDK